MELGEKELEKIGSYVKAHLSEWMGEVMDKRFTQLQRTMSIGFTVLAALMAVFNFF